MVFKDSRLISQDDDDEGMRKLIGREKEKMQMEEIALVWVRIGSKMDDENLLRENSSKW